MFYLRHKKPPYDARCSIRDALGHLRDVVTEAIEVPFKAWIFFASNFIHT